MVNFRQTAYLKLERRSTSTDNSDNLRDTKTVTGVSLERNHQECYLALKILLWNERTTKKQRDTERENERDIQKVRWGERVKIIITFVCY